MGMTAQQRCVHCGTPASWNPRALLDLCEHCGKLQPVNLYGCDWILLQLPAPGDSCRVVHVHCARCDGHEMVDCAGADTAGVVALMRPVVQYHLRCQAAAHA